MGESPTTQDLQSQNDKFKELARELECDESAERFEQTVKKIAAKPPTVKDEPKVG